MTLSYLITSDMIAITAVLSWLQDGKIWIKVSISYSKFLFLVATVTCHGSPRFPNKSFWLSLYFLGKNVMAQSCTRRTDDSSSKSSTSSRAASWLTERRRCDFQAKIAFFACFTLKVSFLLPLVIGWHSVQWAPHRFLGVLFTSNHFTSITHFVVLVIARRLIHWLIWITERIACTVVSHARTLRNMNLFKK